MQVKALKSFMGRHGYIRQGQTVNLEDGYARDLAKNKLVELPGEGDGGPKAEAPRARPAILGGARARPGASEKPPGKEAQLGDGPTLTPLSSRAAQARPKKTPNASARGGRKASATKIPAPKASDQKPGDDA